VQIATGFLYLYYKYPSGSEIQSMDVINLKVVAIIHTIGAFALVAFVIAHVYLTTTGHKPLSAIKAMITGWEELDQEEEANSDVHDRSQSHKE